MEGNMLPYVAAPLTNLSQKYRNADDSYIAGLVAPELLVPRKTGKYLYYPQAIRTAVNSLRTGRAKTAEVTTNFIWKDFGTLEERAVKHGIEKDTLDMYEGPLDPMVDAMQTIMDEMRNEYEGLIANYLSNTTYVTQYSNPSVQWNGATGAGSPIIDITSAATSMLVAGLRRPNTIVMGWQVWQQLATHPDFMDRIKFSQLGVLTPALFKDIINETSMSKIDNVYIGAAIIDTSAEQIPHAGTTSNGFVWGKNLWLMYLTPTPSLREVNAMYTLRLNNGRYVDGWYENDPKTTFIRVNDYYTPFLVGPTAVYLLQSVVA